MSISAKSCEKARRELGENDDRKEKCLCQFREWIDNHSYIRKCRRGDRSVLKFYIG